MARRSTRRANSGAVLVRTARRPVSSRPTATDLTSPYATVAPIAAVLGRRVKRYGRSRLSAGRATGSQGGCAVGSQVHRKKKESPGSGTRGFPFQPPEEFFGRKPSLCGPPPKSISDRRKLGRGCSWPTRVTFKPRIFATIGQLGANGGIGGLDGRIIAVGLLSPAMQSFFDSRRGQLPVCGSRGSRVIARPPPHPRHEQHHQRRQPHHARAVAVVRIRERAADCRIGEDRQRDDRGQFAERRRIRGRRAASASTATSSSIDPHATGTCRRLIAVKSSSPRCWRAAFIAANACGANGLDDPGVCQISVWTP